MAIAFLQSDLSVIREPLGWQRACDGCGYCGVDQAGQPSRWDQLQHLHCLTCHRPVLFCGTCVADGLPQQARCDCQTGQLLVPNYRPLPPYGPLETHPVDQSGLWIKRPSK